jgi:hypothetical protein
VVWIFLLQKQENRQEIQKKNQKQDHPQCLHPIRGLQWQDSLLEPLHGGLKPGAEPLDQEQARASQRREIWEGSCRAIFFSDAGLNEMQLGAKGPIDGDEPTENYANLPAVHVHEPNGSMNAAEIDFALSLLLFPIHL